MVFNTEVGNMIGLDHENKEILIESLLLPDLTVLKCSRNVNYFSSLILLISGEGICMSKCLSTSEVISI